MSSTSERDLRAGLAGLVADEPAERDWAAAALVRARRQHRRRFAAQAIGVVLILAVVVTVPLTVRASRSGVATQRPATSVVDPTALVGDWTVQAPEEETGATLRLGDQLTLSRSCGSLTGAWGANRSGAFVAEVENAPKICGAQTIDQTPSWLARATSFHPTVDGGFELFAADGTSVALLTRGPAASFVPAEASPPTLDAALRARLASPAPLPSGVVAASMVDVAGSWQPVGYTSPSPYAKVVVNTPYLRLLADGQWTSSDGCGMSDQGRWVSGPGDGRLIVLGSLVSLGKCLRSADDTWENFVAAARLGLRGSELVLDDAAGHQLLAFRRVPDPTDAVSLAVRQRLLGFAQADAKSMGGTATDVIAVRTTSAAEDSYLSNSSSPARFSKEVWLVQFYGDFTCTGCSVPAGAKLPTGTVAQFADTVDGYQPVMDGLTRSVRPLSGLGTVIALG